MKCNVAGQPTSIKDALGHVTSLAYQGYDLQSVSDALNRSTSFVVDALGRFVATRDPLGNVGLIQYDADDRIGPERCCLRRYASRRASYLDDHLFDRIYRAGSGSVDG
jgi:YD repeat-containing protein